MTELRLSKLSYVLRKCLAHPRRSLTYLRFAHLADDRGYRQLPVWLFGDLPRYSLSRALPGSETIDIDLPRALDRSFGTSITPEEACCLCVIQRHLNTRTVLEIGTSDGNTTLALAANLEDGGMVSTLDLPPSFNLTSDRTSLAYPYDHINLTPRDRVGRQFRSHPLAPRIRQVFGDSGTLDWDTLDGPFNLIFIDGSHTASYVESDTANAIRHVTTPGAIVWHDYGLYPDVSRVVDQVARQNDQLWVFAIERTGLAVGLLGLGNR